MPDQAPKIELGGKGRLVYDKTKRTIVHGSEGKWKPIVMCPTDDSEHRMMLEDATEFTGRWSTSQRQWQRARAPIERQAPERVINGETLRAEKTITTIWTNLPEGVYPTHFV